MIRIYTDGACAKNGSDDAKASWALIAVNNRESYPFLTISGAVEGKQTNNMGELIAILKAIETSEQEGFESVVIYSDSKYAINSICHWNIEKKVRGKRKKNYELIKEIKSLIKVSSCDFEIVWVKGHSGDKFNDLADQHAKAVLNNSNLSTI